jgi:hypothetical protein
MAAALFRFRIVPASGACTTRARGTLHRSQEATHLAAVGFQTVAVHSPAVARLAEKPEGVGECDTCFCEQSGTLRQDHLGGSHRTLQSDSGTSPPLCFGQESAKGATRTDSHGENDVQAFKRGAGWRVHCRRQEQALEVREAGRRSAMQRGNPLRDGCRQSEWTTDLLMQPERLPISAEHRK